MFFIMSILPNASAQYKAIKYIPSGKAMVSSAHPLASMVGTQILQKGGNAIDAAIATHFALAVCYPSAGNIGGGGFMVIRMSDGSTATLDYREKAPLKVVPETFWDENKNLIDSLSLVTHLGAGVPGSVAGMWEAHKKYSKLSWAELINPAIELAASGFALTRIQADDFNRLRPIFIQRNKGKTDIAFLAKDVWKEGDIFTQPQLAETLIRLRDEGAEEFYNGQTAELLVQEMSRGNGKITLYDLQKYKAIWRKPFSFVYKDFYITTMGLPSSGGLLLAQMLKMLENKDLQKIAHNSADYVHLLSEIERRAFVDRAYYMGDSDFVKVPDNELISKEYLELKMKTFSHKKATKSEDITHGKIQGYESEETTHFSVTDEAGNAVSVTTTLNDSYGSKIVVDGAGFILNNEMDDFSLKPGTPNMYGLVGGTANAVEPGKRMLSSMTPTIVSKHGKLIMVLGSPGGSTIPTSVLQVLLNVLVYNMPANLALSSSRFHHQWLPDQIFYEENKFSQEILNDLTKRGHTLQTRSSIGRVELIVVNPDGSYQGGADPRGDDSVGAY